MDKAARNSFILIYLLSITLVLTILAYVFIRFVFNATFINFIYEGAYTILLFGVFILTSLVFNVLYTYRWKKGKPLLGMFSLITPHRDMNGISRFSVIKEYMLLRLDAMPFVIIGYSFIMWYIIQPTLYTISFTQAELLFTIITVIYMVSYIIYVLIMGLMLYLDLMAKDEVKAQELSNSEINNLVLGIFK